MASTRCPKKNETAIHFGRQKIYRNAARRSSSSLIATRESTSSSLGRVLSDYRRSMLYARKEHFLILAFEHELAAGLKILGKKSVGLMRKFNDIASQRLHLSAYRQDSH
jgi:hypothetical protein